MKIVSWNVNSVRMRLPHILDWCAREKPDVLCLQETKVVNEDFPAAAFKALGLNCYIHGQKSYNGVAFITPHEMENVQTGFIDNVDLAGHKRVIRGQLKGVDIINVYVPQGQEVGSEKFELKRQFYKNISELLEKEYSAERPLILTGDFNIAPSEKDVDDVKKRSGKCMFTEEEHSWLARLEAWGLKDSLRLQTDAQVFSWWDYREGAVAQNRGLRIDMMYVTEAAAAKLSHVEMHREERLKEQPSDHVPVVTVLQSTFE